MLERTSFILLFLICETVIFIIQIIIAYNVILI